MIVTKEELNREIRDLKTELKTIVYEFNSVHKDILIEIMKIKERLDITDKIISEINRMGKDDSK